MAKTHKVVKILMISVLPMYLSSQVESIVLFNNLGVNYQNTSLTDLPGIYHTYTLKSLSCYGFIFDKSGEIWYRDFCPHDYIDFSKFGIYKIKGDTIDIVTTFLTTAERIHSIAIREIEQIDISRDTFFVNSLNSSKNEEGKVFSVCYVKLPRWPWNKEKWIDLRRPIDWSKLPKKIYVKQIWVSELKNQSPNNGICFRINEKWETRNKEINITFFGEPIKIIKKNQDIILLKWNRLDKRYIEYDKLIHGK